MALVTPNDFPILTFSIVPLTSSPIQGKKDPWPWRIQICGFLPTSFRLKKLLRWVVAYIYTVAYKKEVQLTWLNFQFHTVHCSKLWVNILVWLFAWCQQPWRYVQMMAFTSQIISSLNTEVFLTVLFSPEQTLLTKTVIIKISFL